jgi:hypothetical protein
MFGIYGTKPINTSISSMARKFENISSDKILLKYRNNGGLGSLEGKGMK